MIPENAVRLGIGELVARLGFCRATVRSWVLAGKLPPPHYVAGCRRWWLHEIEAWEALNVTTGPARHVARVNHDTGHMSSTQ